MKLKLQLTSIGFLLCLGGGFLAGLLGLSTSLSELNLGPSQEALRLMDRRINESLPLMSRLNAWLAGLNYRVLNDAGAWVKPGCKDWLFLTEELREFPDGKRNLEKRIRIARAIIQKFSHTKLIILPIPDKSELAAGSLCDTPVTSQAKMRVQEWRAAMHGLAPQVELAAGWPAPGFLRTDSHWDTTGAQFAARKLATAIVAAIGARRTEVTLAREPSIDRAGDLIRLADLAQTYPWSGPLPDRVSPAVAHVKFAGGLLDQTAAPRILLAGSSFSLNSSFIDFLQFELQEPVLQVSKEGAGFAGALFKLMERNSVEFQNASAIIWEFPMRSLTQPLTEEEQRFLSRAH